MPVEIGQVEAIFRYPVKSMRGEGALKITRANSPMPCPEGFLSLGSRCAQALKTTMRPVTRSRRSPPAPKFTPRRSIFFISLLAV
jgi:hypothetical protein